MPEYVYLRLDDFTADVKAENHVEEPAIYSYSEPSKWTTDPDRSRNPYDDEDATHVRLERSWAEANPALQAPEEASSSEE